MSMLLMAKAMKMKVGNPLRKLVLLKLADNANDNAECWPSYKHIAEQCEISRRSVMNHIQALCDAGLVRKEVRKISDNKNQSNIYILDLGGESLSLPKKRSESPAPPSESPAPPSESPAPSGGESPAPRTSNLSDPVIEPVNEPKKKKSDHDFSSWPKQPSQEVFDEWLAMRKRKKAPTTPFVMKRIGDQLTIAVKQGTSVDECLAECVVRNWTGFKAEWINRPQFGQRPHAPVNTKPETQDYTGYDSESGKQLWGDE